MHIAHNVTDSETQKHTKNSQIKKSKKLDNLRALIDNPPAAPACDVENCLGCVDANICEECEDGFEEDGQGACMEGGGATAGITSK